MEGGMAEVDEGLAGARLGETARAGRSETAAVEVRGLTKTFGRVTAVREMTFTAPAGKVTGFLGPNGSGKTTTLRMVLGLVRPDAGEALIGGVRYGRLAWPRRSVGALLEATSFHPGRRARDHLRVLADAADVPARRVDEVLDQVDLAPAARRRVREFSLGMRQRLGLAAALLGDPQVLLLDEPGNGLDPAGIAWLRGLLRGLADEGRTVVIASHVLSEVAQTVDHVVIVSEGRLRFAGPLGEIGAENNALESAFLRLTATPGRPPGPSQSQLGINAKGDPPCHL
jgi:ABC-2 type transport system ATP-binding protein